VSDAVETFALGLICQAYADAVMRNYQVPSVFRCEHLPYNRNEHVECVISLAVRLVGDGEPLRSWVRAHRRRWFPDEATAPATARS
jgi:hypothetical protein